MNSMAKVLVGSVAILLLTLPVKAEVIRVAVEYIPKHLDIAKASDGMSLRMLALTSPSLMGQGVREPSEHGLAQSVSRNEMADVYTVYLKSDEISSKQISENYVKLSASNYRSYVSQISEIRTPKNDVIEFVLKAPNPWFWPAFQIPMEGLGAYRVAKKEQHQLVMKPKKTGLPTLHFYGVKDPLVRYLKLKKGEVDIVHNDLPAEIFDYGKAHGMAAHSVPSASYTYIGLNLAEAPFSDLRVRKALSMSIDRQALIVGLLKGQASAADSILLPDTFGYKNAGSYNYVQAEAKELLKAAGYSAASPLKITLNVTTNVFSQRIAQALQYQLQQAGVDMSIQAREWGSFYRDVKKGNFEAYLLSWVGPFEGDFYYHLFHSDNIAPKGLNRSRLDDVFMDTYLEDLMTTKDVPFQKDLLAKIQQYQYDNMLYVPLWRGNHMALTHPSVKGYTLDKTGGFLTLMNVSK